MDNVLEFKKTDKKQEVKEVEQKTDTYSFEELMKLNKEKQKKIKEEIDRANKVITSTLSKKRKV